MTFLDFLVDVIKTSIAVLPPTIVALAAWRKAERAEMKKSHHDASEKHVESNTERIRKLEKEVVECRKDRNDSQIQIEKLWARLSETKYGDEERYEKVSRKKKAP